MTTLDKEVIKMKGYYRDMILEWAAKNAAVECFDEETYDERDELDEEEKERAEYRAAFAAYTEEWN